jgi:hypothetical protein
VDSLGLAASGRLGRLRADPYPASGRLGRLRADPYPAAFSARAHICR